MREFKFNKKKIIISIIGILLLVWAMSPKVYVTYKASGQPTENKVRVSLLWEARLYRALKKIKNTNTEYGINLNGHIGLIPIDYNFEIQTITGGTTSIWSGYMLYPYYYLDECNEYPIDPYDEAFDVIREYKQANSFVGSIDYHTEGIEGMPQPCGKTDENGWMIESYRTISCFGFDNITQIQKVMKYMEACPDKEKMKELDVFSDYQWEDDGTETIQEIYLRESGGNIKLNNEIEYQGWKIKIIDNIGDVYTFLIKYESVN